MESLRIIFMGTPEFAVPSLQILVENNFNVVAVVTAPDRPQGRGQKMLSTPIKEFAATHGIPVLQPEKLKSPGFIDQLESLQADLQVVVAFRMLPEIVWNMPSKGTINLHASLLPKYRGAAPINWAIINGEKETGVTTFFLRQEIDTGSIIYQEKESIRMDDDAGTLYDRLKTKGAGLVLKTAQAITAGQYPSLPQADNDKISHAPKIFKDMCKINWMQKATDVRNFVRGMSPYPAAWTVINGKTFKIFRASISEFQKQGISGEFYTNNKEYLYIKAADAWVSIEELQIEGKRRMGVKEFLKGNKIE